MANRPLAEAKCLPAALGLGGLAAVLALTEMLIRLGWVNRFIVPLPSEVFVSFERIILEENVLSRFLATAGEALAAAFLVSLTGVAPSLSSTAATGTAPRRSSGMPTTAASSTLGCSRNMASTSRGSTLKPPRMMASSARPRM